MSETRTVRVNLLAFVDQGEVGTDPYRVDREGAPYVAVGDGGVVLGLRLGDGVFDHAGDHAAPGACLVHTQSDAGHALVGLACLGNLVTVRTGDATGATGAVLGKRGGGERVIAIFEPEDLARLRPGDQIVVTSHGQGATSPRPDVVQLNVSPAALDALGVSTINGVIDVGVRTSLESRHVGNGIGRPMAMWDVDLQVDRHHPGVAPLRLGDLVAIRDLDGRTNAGYRRGFVSIGVVVHGSSPLPGHGPGVTIILSGPAAAFSVRDEGDAHQNLSEGLLLAIARSEE